MNKAVKKEHPLIFWVGISFGTMIGIFALILALTARSGIRQLNIRTADSAWDILRLRTENMDSRMASLQTALYQLTVDNEDIVRLETGTDETQLFLARQNLAGNFSSLLGWNSEIEALFFYSPQARVPDYIGAAAAGDVAVEEELEREVRNHIDREPEEGRMSETSFFAVLDGRGYLIRFFRARNSFLGMCVSCDEILSALEKLEDPDYVTAFLCSPDGTVYAAAGPEAGLEKIGMENMGRSVRMSGRRFLLTMAQSEEGDYCLGLLTDERMIFRQVSGIYGAIVLFILSAAAFTAAMLAGTGKIFYRPLEELQKRIRRLSDGSWEYDSPAPSRIREYNQLNRNFSDMVREIRDLKIANYEKELKIQKSYLQYLQLQANPHFYLNVFNIIYSLAEVKKYETIQEVTMALVQYSRYTFRDPSKMVSIAQEMELVENYIRIQQIRFPDRIEYHENVSPEAEDAMIPPFVIQTFVENSIKYGIKADRDNSISVAGKIIEVGEDLAVQIEIRDNGPGYDDEVLGLMRADGWAPEESGHHIGINNVMQRLQLVFGTEATLVLKNDHGARTILIVPLKLEE